MRREPQAEPEQRQQDFHGGRVTYFSFQSQMKQILTLGAAGSWGNEYPSQVNAELRSEVSTWEK